MFSPSRPRAGPNGGGVSSTCRARRSRSLRRSFGRSARRWRLAPNSFTFSASAIVRSPRRCHGIAVGDRPHSDHATGRDGGIVMARVRSLAGRLCRRRDLSAPVGGTAARPSSRHARGGSVSTPEARPVLRVARHARPSAGRAGALRAAKDPGPGRATGRACALSSLRALQRARGRARARHHAPVSPRLPVRARGDARGPGGPTRKIVRAPSFTPRVNSGSAGSGGHST